ncbi:hypothetical protein FRB95_014453 [Tulasnella sp. JGI-2019a]|nr:hypothetical protein FRB95_014453 [Tulasnella sp. JGI-2019a]
MAESYNSIEKLREHEGVRLWLDFKEEQQTDLSLWINATGYPADGPNPVALATHLESLRRKWPIRRTKGSPLRQLRSICRQAFPRERVEHLHIELILLSQPRMKDWGSTLYGDAARRTQTEKDTEKKGREGRLESDRPSRKGVTNRSLSTMPKE